MPARSTNTTVKITILDNDDLDPKFTRDVYKAKIYEFYPMPVSILWIYCYYKGRVVQAFVLFKYEVSVTNDI